jgi:hypothetical protein
MTSGKTLAQKENPHQAKGNRPGEGNPLTLFYSP